MAGSGFEFDISEMENISKAFEQVEKIHFQSLLNTIGVTEETEIKERFDRKKDPNGKDWKSWSPKYAKKQDKGDGILVKSGRLKESVGFEVKSYGVLWGSTMIYARAHQEGFDDRNLPARSYLGVGESSQELIGDTIEEFLEMQSGGLL